MYKMYPKVKKHRKQLKTKFKKTQEQENNEEIGNPLEPQHLDPLVHVQQPKQ